MAVVSDCYITESDDGNATHHLQATLDRVTGIAIPRLQVNLRTALEATAEPALEQLNHLMHLVHAFAHRLDRPGSALKDGYKAFVRVVLPMNSLEHHR